MIPEIKLKDPGKRLELKEYLDFKAAQYERPEFLVDDPIQVPHKFSRKEDIEVAAFLTAVIAWGNRKSIIRSALRMVELMDSAPYEFIRDHSESDLQGFSSFVHRTFNETDLTYFITALSNIYREEGGLEKAFSANATEHSLQPSISAFKRKFFSYPHPKRTTKHLPDPSQGSAAKRINMFLRWMVRPAGAGVDFGLWKTLNPSQLSCPLDVHSGGIARKLGLIGRKQNDARAVAELDSVLRSFDPADPVKYDFALFGIGAYEDL